MKPTIAFHHFGCKVNFAEASALSRQFREKGYLLAGFHEKADIYVISSCVVTSAAEKKCKAAIRQANRLNPDARIAVIGCFPELKADEVAAMQGVDVVLGHSAKFNLLEELEGRGKKEEGRRKSHDFIPAYSSEERTRVFLKIQDGCDYYCAYCAIPLARGNSRSDTIDHLLKEAAEIVSSGVKEFVLTGVNIGDFGKQNGETFYELISRLEQEISVPRIRISSIEPDLLSDEIIELVASSGKFLPHFHIPLQSGSNKILKAMKRKYTQELYADRIDKIRSRMPFACIAADVIVGFPGETDEDFTETVDFVKTTAVSYVHVFSYSRRENTLAAKSAENCSPAEKKRRSDQLHDLSDRKKTRFYQSNRGREVSVLFESDNKDGFMHGFSENYLKVKTPYTPRLVNEIRRVKLEQLEEDLTYVVRW
ncbi:MAG: tRNA (N(6)-L-threonylcarbamoyladenosine(37)-C(2))-methylthiotransferase MtaB [bacterium]